MRRYNYNNRQVALRDPQGTIVRAIVKTIVKTKSDNMSDNINDEIDFEVGTTRFKECGGHGGHNGVRDIIDAIGGKKNFFRLRIGVGHPGHKSMVANYVLSDPSRAEADAIMSNIEDAIRVVPKTVTGDWEEAMKFLHSN